MDTLIPFNSPSVSEASRLFINEILNSSHHQGDGEFTAHASREISRLCGGGHVLLTPSCTHALELGSLLADISPGDEVIMPSFTFTSAATAVTQFGGIPVFVDIENEFGCIDVDLIEAAISSRTKAISWVNYAGNTPNIEKIQKIAQKHNLFTIEDNAHGLGGSYAGRPLGSFGDISTLSFHATKNIQCGEGGAVVINKPELIARAEIMREKGTNRKLFLSGEVQKYQWVDRGSSYLLAEVLAGLLLGQLQDFEHIQSARLKTWSEYKQATDECGIKILETNSKNVAHMFALKTQNSKQRQALQIAFKENGIQTTFHYQPLHSSRGGIAFGKISSEFLNTQHLSDTILRLPIWSRDMSKEYEHVISVLSKIC